MNRFAHSFLLLAGLTSVAIAQLAQTPAVTDTLDEVRANGVPERQRQPQPSRTSINPNVIDVTRNGAALMRLKPVDVTNNIRFRRESAARLLPEGANRSLRLQHDALNAASGPISDATLELAADIDEADGLPASVRFGPRSSLVNIDYVRLQGSTRDLLINVSNVLDPQTRRCVGLLRVADEGSDYPNRFLLVGDKLDDCLRAEKSREGDLFFSDGVPEQLRQAIRDIYEPVYNRFAAKLGSEPSITFVVWRPDYPRRNFRFERNWNRTNLLLFNGSGWQVGLGPQQREELWDKFAEEQILRRFPNRSDAFAQSAVNYLILLAKSGRNGATQRELARELPVWVAACARQLDVRSSTNRATQEVAGADCGLLLQFIYDAVARAKSKGNDTVFRVWRDLLNESFRRGQTSVKSGDFIGTSGDAQRLTEGLMDGTMDWERFAVELDRFGVRIRLSQGPSGPIIEVVSLAHFDDQVSR